MATGSMVMSSTMLEVGFSSERPGKSPALLGLIWDLRAARHQQPAFNWSAETVQAVEV
jgi:hypothetical protein